MENKHGAYDLIQMQSLPLDAKISMSRRRIIDWYEHWGGDVCVSFSGGKDSTVLKHLVDSIYEDVPAVYVDTGLEYPEVRRFVRAIKDGKHAGFNTDVVMLRPKMRFDEVIKEKGYPVVSKEVSLYVYQCQHPTQNNATTRNLRINGVRSDGVMVKIGKIPSRFVGLVDAPFKVSNLCCDAMKKKPLKEYSKKTGRASMQGILATESRIRARQWMKTGCNAFNLKDPKSTPLAFWTENDILEYIKINNLPLASVYGDVIETGQIIENACGQVAEYKTTGCDRTGCMFCLYGAHLEKGVGRFERMKQTHPKQYEYCMKSVEDGGLGLKDVIDWMNENTGTNIKY